MSDRSYLTRIGAVLIVTCIVILLAGILLYGFIYRDHQQENVSIQFVLQTDTLGRISQDVKFQADTLMAMMERHEHLLQDKYQHILEQKEIFNDVLTLGGMLLAVVLSLFGFFGYKSLNSIEDKVKEQVEQMTDKIFKQQFEAYKTSKEKEMIARMEIDVKEVVSKNFTKYKQSVNHYVAEKVKDSVDSKTIEVNELKLVLDDVKKSLDNIDEKVSKLQDRVIKLENGSYSPPQNRRTLANAGRLGVVTGLKEISNKEEEK